MSDTDRPPKTRRDRPSPSSRSRRRRSDRRAPYPFDLSVEPSPEPSAPVSAAEARRALDEALAELDRVFREPRERDGTRERHATGEHDGTRDRDAAREGDGISEGDAARQPDDRGRGGAGRDAPSAEPAEGPAELPLPVRAPAPPGGRGPGWRRVAYPLVAAACVIGLIALLRTAGPEAGRGDAVAGARTAALAPAWARGDGDPVRPGPGDDPAARSGLADLAASSLDGLAASALDDLAASGLGDLAGVPGLEASEVAPYWLSPAGDAAPERAPLPAAPSLRLRLTEPPPAALDAQLSGVEEVAVAAVTRPVEGAAVARDEPGPAALERAAAGGAPREPYDVLPRPRALEAFRDRVAALAARAFRVGEDRVLKLEATIGPDGRVAHLQTVRSTGVRDLDFAIMALVRDLEFSPALRDGEPVEAVITWPITLRGRDLEDEDGDRR